ncbi:hypothetical protein [Nonomuraea basaltis]|uniref:hypothetical protein n=1 Tax=Nonomuraea basaltis TaxID=2495887 RepID=UPI00110C524E|nr:hypothetical protein [Nonomuraea basaltis]TMS00128.1 hypothetical protein EJK15_03390 [Nonomuraea basaltis]
MTSPTPRTWTITLPAGVKLLNANDRLHWAAEARITKDLRTLGHVLALKAKIPHLERAHIVCVYQPPDRRARDSANLHPTVKALVDGMVSDAKILPDDSSRYLSGPLVEIGEVYPKGRMVLHIAEVLPPEPDGLFPAPDQTHERGPLL